MVVIDLRENCIKNIHPETFAQLNLLDQTNNQTNICEKNLTENSEETLLQIRCFKIQV